MAKMQKPKLYPKATLKRLVDLNSPKFEKRVIEISLRAINNSIIKSARVRKVIARYA